MVLIGCRPQGRSIEQHDIFFGVASSLKELLPAMKASWPEAKGKIHIDAWREVTCVDGYSISVGKGKPQGEGIQKLFFINLGGYKPGDFEEYHYKILSVATDMSGAIRKSKQTSFYKHASIAVKGGESHVDDKYGVEADDILVVSDIVEQGEYYLLIEPAEGLAEDQLHIGYIKTDKLK